MQPICTTFSLSKEIFFLPACSPPFDTNKRMHAARLLVCCHSKEALSKDMDMGKVGFEKKEEVEEEKAVL